MEVTEQGKAKPKLGAAPMTTGAALPPAPASSLAPATTTTQVSPGTDRNSQGCCPTKHKFHRD